MGILSAAEGPGPLSLSTGLVAKIWCFHCCDLSLPPRLGAQALGSKPLQAKAGHLKSTRTMGEDDGDGREHTPRLHHKAMQVMPCTEHSSKSKWLLKITVVCWPGTVGQSGEERDAFFFFYL